MLLSLCWGLPAVPRWLRVGAAVLLVTIPWWPREQAIPPGQLHVTVYDVGQGQLIELRSANFRLLYDTGHVFAVALCPCKAYGPQVKILTK